MVMWKFKNCPRCKGDIFIYKDLDGWYEECLQCSYRHELRDIAEFKKLPASAEKEGAKNSLVS